MAFSEFLKAHCNKDSTYLYDHREDEIIQSPLLTNSQKRPAKVRPSLQKPIPKSVASDTNKVSILRAHWCLLALFQGGMGAGERDMGLWAHWDLLLPPPWGNGILQLAPEHSE